MLLVTHLQKVIKQKRYLYHAIIERQKIGHEFPCKTIKWPPRRQQVAEHVTWLPMRTQAERDRHLQTGADAHQRSAD